MRKMRLKRWVEVVLGVIAFMAFCVMCSECDDMAIFVISKIIAVIVFGVSTGILNEYSR